MLILMGGLHVFYIDFLPVLMLALCLANFLLLLFEIDRMREREREIKIQINKYKYKKNLCCKFSLFTIRCGIWRFCLFNFNLYFFLFQLYNIKYGVVNVLFALYCFVLFWRLKFQFLQQTIKLEKGCCARLLFCVYVYFYYMLTSMSYTYLCIYITCTHAHIHIYPYLYTMYTYRM